MRTITVVFTNRMLSVKEMLSHKRYKFLCNYDTILRFNKNFVYLAGRKRLPLSTHIR